MLTISTIIGARPQFIKAAIVSHHLRTLPDVREQVIHTGQHYDSNMSDVFFSELDMLPPDLHLAIGSDTHAKQTGRMMIALDEVFATAKPDWVLLYGDTNSTLAGALVASKLHIPIMHVEAGLRSFNSLMPEEINRVLTDAVSNALMVPTVTARDQLICEGRLSESIHLVGDVMYDAALHYANVSKLRWPALATRLQISNGRYLLATIHRAENTDVPARLTAILDGLSFIAQELPVVLPLHPRTKARAGTDALLRLAAAGVNVVDPVGYLDMIQLEKNAAVIMTDSGGVQKEAFFYRVPCVTLRTETEWTETVELGWNRLCAIDSPELIAQTCLRAVQSRGKESQPYGTGDAALKIANFFSTCMTKCSANI